MPAVTIRDDIGSEECAGGRGAGERRTRQRRLIAIANALEGMDRASAARLAGMVDAEIARLLYHRVGTRLTELRDQFLTARRR